MYHKKGFHYCKPTSDEYEEVVKKVISNYFRHYGKDATIPAFDSTEIGKQYVYLRNCNGLLAKYDMKSMKWID